MSGTAKPFSYTLGGLWALVIGPLPLALLIAGMAVVATFLSGSPAAAPVGLLMGFYAWLVSVPVWAIGITLVGIPAWWVVRRLGRGTAADAAGLGALLVGAVWAAVLLGIDRTVGFNSLAPAIAVGVLSGGLAGYAGWRGGRSKAPRT